MNVPPIRIKPFFRKAVKFVVSLFCAACLVVFCDKVWTGRNDIASAFDAFFSSPHLIAAEVVLLFANLALEIFRWQTLRSVFTQGTWRDDIAATLRSVSLGNSTPANIGEHVGRGMTYDNKGSATMASLVASVVQTAAIVAWGFFASLFFFGTGDDFVPSVAVSVCLWGSLACALIAAVLFFVFRNRISPVGSWGGGVAFAFVINVAKVAVFSFQFALLLSVGSFPSLVVLFAVATYYFFVTIVPRVNIIDVGLKGGLANWILTPLCEESVVASSVIFIWVLNIVIPSAIGFISLAFRKRNS